MRILACLDLSQYATSVTDHAAWVAGRLGEGVELLHVIQHRDAVAKRKDLSGALGLGAKSTLMEELVSIEETQARLAREQGEQLLANAKDRLAEKNVAEVEAHMLHGDIVDTIIEREAAADLVVIGKRGASADFARTHLGSKIERVVRQSGRPVLVANREFAAIEKVLVAFDNSAATRKAVAMAATSPLFEGVTAHLVMVGGDEPAAQSGYDWACEMLGERLGSHERMTGEVEGALIAEAGRLDADMILMGAYGHSTWRQLFMGSTTAAILRGVALPVLLFRS
ncbi:universal stress protein [Sphingomicrobium sp. XHP0235]|uniref:universal stress protein n=1 Tax=Sphingomicrobium aquimarinum TaxID=3133971 RepID=UPI0031FEB5ED